MAAILLQLILLGGYAAGTAGGWLSPDRRRLRTVHVWLPALAAAQAAYLIALSGGELRTDLAMTVPAFTLAVLAVSWLQNVAWPVYGTYRFVMPVCLAGILASALSQGDAAPGSLSLWGWMHVLTATASYALIAQALVLMLVQGMEGERLARDIGEGDAVPLLTVERMSVWNVYAGFAVLTLTLGSGMAASIHGGEGALDLTHKNLFAILTWIVLLAFIAGHCAWGWRGRTALKWMGTGFAFLLLSYIGSAFVLQVLLDR